MPVPEKSEIETSRRESPWKRIRKSERWGVLTETFVILSMLLVALGLFAFIQIAEEVSEGDMYKFDAALLKAFRDPVDLSQTIGPGWVKTMALDITALGGTTVLIIVVLITLGFLWIAKKRKAFILVAVAAVGGQIFNSGLKELFARPRPSVVPHLAEVHTPSFPSGHSMMSAVIYLTLGILVSNLVEGRRQRAFIIVVAVMLTVLVGISRVFLGVHYPSDVLAGWSVGLTWALICVMVERILQRRGKVEKPGEHTDRLIQISHEDDAENGAA